MVHEYGSATPAAEAASSSVRSSSLWTSLPLRANVTLHTAPVACSDARVAAVKRSTWTASAGTPAPSRAPHTASIIGAGPHTDGQILVWTDWAGMNTGRIPSFVKQYANLAQVLGDAAKKTAPVTLEREGQDTAKFDLDPVNRRDSEQATVWSAWSALRRN